MCYLKIWSTEGREKAIVLLLTRNLVCIQIKTKHWAAAVPRFHSNLPKWVISCICKTVKVRQAYSKILSRFVTIPIMLQKKDREREKIWNTGKPNQNYLPKQNADARILARFHSLIAIIDCKGQDSLLLQSHLFKEANGSRRISTDLPSDRTHQAGGGCVPVIEIGWNCRYCFLEANWSVVMVTH